MSGGRSGRTCPTISNERPVAAAGWAVGMIGLGIALALLGLMLGRLIA